MTGTFTMVGETMFFTFVVAWYTFSDGAFISINNDHLNRGVLNLLSHCRVQFEKGVPVGIHDSRSELGIGFLRSSARTSATTTTTSINLDVVFLLAQGIDGRNTRQAGKPIHGPTAVPFIQIFKQGMGLDTGARI